VTFFAGEGKQPARKPDEGELSVRRLEDDTIRVQLAGDRGVRKLDLSLYNAYRLVGMLCLMLGLKSWRAIGKIKL